MQLYVQSIYTNCDQVRTQPGSVFYRIRRRKQSRASCVARKTVLTRIPGRITTVNYAPHTHSHYNCFDLKLHIRHSHFCFHAYFVHLVYLTHPCATGRSLYYISYIDFHYKCPRLNKITKVEIVRIVVFARNESEMTTIIERRRAAEIYRSLHLNSFCILYGWGSMCVNANSVFFFCFSHKFKSFPQTPCSGSSWSIAHVHLICTVNERIFTGACGRGSWKVASVFYSWDRI